MPLGDIIVLLLRNMIILEHELLSRLKCNSPINYLYCVNTGRVKPKQIRDAWDVIEIVFSSLRTGKLLHRAFNN